MLVILLNLNCSKLRKLGI